MKRRLAVILASDVAGYSAMIAVDEENTIRRFTDLSRTMTELVEKHEGRVFNTAGDAVLAEFNGPVSAVRCAIDFHEACRSPDQHAAPKDIRLRIGIAVGDIIVADNGDLLGDAVNIAARLCALAEPATTCISEEVERMVRNKVAIALTDGGEHRLKNIPEPVHVYRITEGSAQVADTARSIRQRMGWLVSVLVLACVATGAAYLVWKGRHSQDLESGIPFNLASIPLISDVTREKIAQAYPAAKEYKALALSNEGDHYGIAGGKATAQEARTEALADCQSDSHRPCSLYAANDQVMADFAAIPMPWPEETNPEAPGATLNAEIIPLAHEGQRARIAKSAFVLKPHNAVALGMRGQTGWAGIENGSTKAEAARRALQFCGFRTGSACLLYAVDGVVTTQLPVSKPIIGVMLFADAKDIPDDQRKRLAGIYASGGWQALAKGRNGTWHAVAGKTDEAVAVREALTACTASDRDCELVAIGQFRVDGR